MMPFDTAHLVFVNHMLKDASLFLSAAFLLVQLHRYPSELHPCQLYRCQLHLFNSCKVYMN
jgi:hypothetical protein